MNNIRVVVMKDIVSLTGCVIPEILSVSRYVLLLDIIYNCCWVAKLLVILLVVDTVIVAWTQCSVGYLLC